jgi:hypothetical protein
VVTIKVNLTSDGSFARLFDRPPGESYITDGSTVIALCSLLLAEGARHVRIVESAAYAGLLEPFLAQAGWDVQTLLALGNIGVGNTRNRGEGQSYARLSVPSGGYLFS